MDESRSEGIGVLLAASLALALILHFDISSELAGYVSVVYCLCLILGLPLFACWAAFSRQS